VESSGFIGFSSVTILLISVEQPIHLTILTGEIPCL
jgi:hypothetical protein